jgi:hypothetical protein
LNRLRLNPLKLSLLELLIQLGQALAHLLNLDLPTLKPGR